MSPSTSLAGSIAAITASWSICSGSGSWTRIPSTVVVGVERRRSARAARPSGSRRRAAGGSSASRPPRSACACWRRRSARRGRRRRAPSPGPGTSPSRSATNSSTPGGDALLDLGGDRLAVDHLAALMRPSSAARSRPSACAPRRRRRSGSTTTEPGSTAVTTPSPKLACRTSSPTEYGCGGGAGCLRSGAREAVAATGGARTRSRGRARRRRAPSRSGSSPRGASISCSGSSFEEARGHVPARAAVQRAPARVGEPEPLRGRG